LPRRAPVWPTGCPPFVVVVGRHGPGGGRGSRGIGVAGGGGGGGGGGGSGGSGAVTRVPATVVVCTHTTHMHTLAVMQEWARFFATTPPKTWRTATINWSSAVT